MVETFSIGNGQTIGCRDLQCNYFATAYNSEGNLLAVLADGSIDHPNGRQAAIMTVRHCVREFTYYIDDGKTGDFFVATAIEAGRKLQDGIYKGKFPRTSLTMAIFVTRRLYYFSVGANRLFLYDNHRERSLEMQQQHCAGRGRYIFGQHDLAPKTIVGLLSAGAYSHCQPMERIKIITSHKKPFDKAQELIEVINAKRLQNQLNTTIVLVEVPK